MPRRAVVLVAIGLGLTSGTGGAVTARSAHVAGWEHHAPLWTPGGEILFSEAFVPPKARPDHRLGLVRRDGGRLRRVLVTRRAVWVTDVSASISPDGNRLLITRAVDAQGTVVVVKDLRTGGERLLTPDGFDDVGGNWSPDGARVSFSRSPRGEERPTVHHAKADGTDTRALEVRGQPLFLPDGRLLVSGPRVVSIMAADGTDELELTAPGRWRAADWSLDASNVLLVRNPGDENPALWSVRSGGSSSTRLVVGADDGAWSPDGRRLVFALGSDRSLYLADADGGQPRRLGVNGRGPAWSPDGALIAFHDRGPCNGAGIYVMSASGTNPRRLTNDCRLTGTAGHDTLFGSRERDVIRGLGGDDRIDANPGDRPNVYFGAEDRDDVDGGPGRDTIFGRRGVDVLRGGPGNDRIYGGAGVDWIYGGAGSDLLDGGRFHDRIAARDGERDVIRCGVGKDVVSADRNDDVARDCEIVRRA